MTTFKKLPKSRPRAKRNAVMRVSLTSKRTLLREFARSQRESDRPSAHLVQVHRFIGAAHSIAKLYGLDPRALAVHRRRESMVDAFETKVAPLFASRTPSGRVDLVREGNTVRATTRGVGAFTLLLSPDVFDFATPVTVIADGKTVFAGPVKPSVETLMTWAARDNDRTMLYGAALPIVLDRR